MPLSVLIASLSSLTRAFSSYVFSSSFVAMLPFGGGAFPFGAFLFLGSEAWFD